MSRDVTSLYAPITTELCVFICHDATCDLKETLQKLHQSVCVKVAEVHSVNCSEEFA